MSTHDDLFVNDNQPSAQPVLDPGISLSAELAAMKARLDLINDNLKTLAEVIRGLVKLQAIANQKLDGVITGKPIFEVMG